jgi:hypothetical protein
MTRLIASVALALSCVQIVHGQGADQQSPTHRCASPWFLCDQRYSAIWVNLQSNPGPWSVSYSYQNCPRTPRGAFRLTVYAAKTAPRIVQRIVRTLPKGARRIGRTEVYWAASGNDTYTFPGTSGFHYYSFEVPGKGGRQSWSMGHNHKLDTFTENRNGPVAERLRQCHPHGILTPSAR